MRIIHGGQVENAVRTTLQTWLSTFLADVEREVGLAPGHVERPELRDWVRTTDPRTIDVKRLPTVAIASEGFAAEPDWDGEDGMSAWFAVSATFYAKGPPKSDHALDNARMLTAAARQALISKQSLGDFAQAVRVLDEGYGVIDANRERTLAGGETVFAVLVAEVTTSDPGPVVPDPPDSYPPHPDPPEADTVTVTVEHLDHMEP